MPRLFVRWLHLSLLASISLVATAQDRPATPPPPTVATDGQQTAEQHAERGERLMQGGRYDGAVAELKEAVRLKPDYALAHFKLGNAYMQMRRAPEAIQSFKEAIRLEPKMDGAHNNLGNVYLAVGRLDQAAEAYKEAARINPAAGAPHLNLGMTYMRMGRDEEAAESLREAFRLAPNNPQAAAMLGETARRLGRYKEAVEALDALGRLAPLQAPTMQNRALCKLYLARGAEAAADARANLKMTGWHEEHSQFMALVAHFGYRQAAREADARTILDEAAANADTTAWPYPIVRYLRRELSAKEVFALANNNDKMTEARAYIGLDLSLAGKKDEALTHLRWVKEYGNGQFVEYPMALTEISRIEAAAAPPAPK
jgi:tetratricopeptide (TPR) repeat protein